MLSHISCHLGLVCVYEWMIFWQDWLGQLGNSPQSVSQKRWGKTSNKHQSPEILYLIALISAQLRWRGIVPCFQKPEQFSVCSLRAHQAKVGEDFILFHNSWKKRSLSHDRICTLIWKTLTTCHSPVKEDYEILIPLSELNYWNWLLRFFTLWNKTHVSKAWR